LQILLNGKGYTTEASDLDELCATLGFADAKVATAMNGSFVAASERKTTKLAENAEVEIVAPRQGG
jgi:sulfur carrier protein